MAAEIVENGVATVDKPIDEIENDETVCRELHIRSRN